MIFLVIKRLWENLEKHNNCLIADRIQLRSGFPQWPENLENESGHKKVMKHEKLAKSHGFCDHSWNFTNFAPLFDQICAFFADIKKFSKSFKKSSFSDLFHKMSQMQI